MKKEFAKVIVDISHEKVDRPFGYRIPERLADSVTPGVRVKIPFGAGNALRTGLSCPSLRTVASMRPVTRAAAGSTCTCRSLHSRRR